MSTEAATAAANDETSSSASTSSRVYTMEQQQILQQVCDFVRQHMEGNDGSHDFAHVQRVRNLALAIAAEERVEDMFAVEVGALMHDVADHKYSGSDTAGAQVSRQFLSSIGVDDRTIDKVAGIVSGVGYTKEAAQEASGTLANRNLLPDELRCVQDADRLDAIGAVGIARCFCFGGSRTRPLYDADKGVQMCPEEYRQQQKGQRSTNSLDHFPEKLLRLQGMMKTKAGARRAVRRHEFMLEFMRQFRDELNEA